MPKRQHVTPSGTWVTIEPCCEGCGNATVTLDHPDAPEDQRNIVVGWVVDKGGFEPVAPEGRFTLGPVILRAIAEYIEARDA